MEKELKVHGLKTISGATGDSANPTALAWRFSPVSNKKRDQISQDDELRVLIATDVLSEGQNLQDCAVVVNYDLPWAIIRLIQRAGRIDRIGQRAEQIFCYSFLPAEGVERINRQLKSGIDDMRLAELVLALKEENRLCIIEGEQQSQEPRIICSMGMFAG